MEFVDIFGNEKEDENRGSLAITLLGFKIILNNFVLYPYLFWARYFKGRFWE